MRKCFAVQIAFALLLSPCFFAGPAPAQETEGHHFGKYPAINAMIHDGEQKNLALDAKDFLLEIWFKPLPPVNYERTVSDGLGSTDVPARAAASLRPAAEAEALADLMDRLVAGDRTVTETLGLADIAIRLGGFLRDAAETEGAADGMAQLAGFLRGAEDLAGLTDALSEMLGHLQ